MKGGNRWSFYAGAAEPEPTEVVITYGSEIHRIKLKPNDVKQKKRIS